MRRIIYSILLFLVLTPFSLSIVRAQATERFTISNGTCVQDPNGAYASLVDCFKAIDSSPPGAAPPAQVPVTASGTPFCKVGDGVYLDTCEVSESTPSVIVRFYGYHNESEKKDVPEEYGEFFCYKTDQSKCESDDFKSIKKTIEGGGIIEEEVCGDGKEALKGTSHKGGCDDEDYFHEGKIYRLGLYHDKNKHTKIAEAAFYIGHFYPTPVVEPLDPREHAKITVKLSGIREAKNKSGDNQNNYKLLLQGRDSTYESSQCVTVKRDQNPVTFVFGNDSQHPSLTRGKYQLKIQERVGEDGNNCKGGFTYWTIPITVGANEVRDSNGKIIEEAVKGKIGKHIKDPNNVESRNFSRQSHSLRLPCAEKDRTKDGRCLAITTGIGKISVQPDTFVSSLYGWLLSLAGVAGLILLLRAGYKILTSGGNKEKVGEAREEIKSVIIGILFLIVALVMLEAIAKDVLKIPGFTP